jgi:hypothetical protein
VRPESLDLFRLGRLLVLLSTASEAKAARPLDLERLGYYDFFAANPFLVFGGDDERRELVLAGFDSRNLSYQSSAQRFTNRRSRLQYDLALLVAYGLVRPEVVAKRVAYGLTDDGAKFADRFESLYARSYRKSAQMIVARLNRLTDARLRGTRSSGSAPRRSSSISTTRRQRERNPRSPPTAARREQGLRRWVPC